MPLRHAALFAALLCAPAAGETPYYAVEGRALTCENGLRYYNRPLYGPNLPSVVLAGDRPQLRFVQEPVVNGDLLIAFVRGEEALWLPEFSCVRTEFRPGEVRWILKDARWPDIELRLEAVHAADGPGFLVKLTGAGLKESDRLVWAYGGASNPESALPYAMWASDPMARDLSKGFLPERAAGNEARTAGGTFFLKASLPETIAAEGGERWSAGRCSAAGKLRIANADAWERPLELVSSEGGLRPVVCGEAALPREQPVYWQVRSYEAEPDRVPALGDPAAAFEAGRARVRAVAGRVTVDTPQPRLNIAVDFANTGFDGLWYPPTFVHGGMLWNIPFPGWRVLYGPTAFGRHEDVAAEGAYYLSRQQTEDQGRGPKADPNLKLTLQAPESRYYGRGRIQQDQGYYNFQEEHFDQLIYAWRATGDAKLEALLRPALELHLEYMRECFDPDDNALYESYINTWATDSVWYNGSDTAQATAYAYTGHRAAAEMARRAGDAVAAGIHHRRAERIAGALDELWLTRRGHLAENREAGPHRRLRPDACLYTVNLPIDAGLLCPFEAAQMLHYAEWALEWEEQPGGGAMCYHSNWLPYIWSVREFEVNETFHLALSHYQTGLSAEGWRLFLGSLNYAASVLSVPGSISSTSGTDFAGHLSMFGRCVVEGLFGYRPDYPNGKVRFSPQFPAEWPEARIETPDFVLDYAKDGAALRYAMELTRPAAIELRVPVMARRIASVTVDGAAAAWRAEPGFGRSEVVIELPPSGGATVEVTCAELLDVTAHAAIEAEPAAHAVFRGGGGPIVAIKDPQEALTHYAVEHGACRAKLTSRPGRYLVFALVDVGELRQWQRFKVAVSDEAARAREAARHIAAPPPDAEWAPVDMTQSFNADVRAVYEQEYRTPRRDRCSVMLGTDGWSGWCAVQWGHTPPALDFERAADLVGAGGWLETPQGAPFQWTSEARNVAFASCWDNYPDRLSVPVDDGGRGIYFLVAGTTTPMHTMLANGVVRVVYADGVTDHLDLVHPDNYLSLSNPYTHPRDAFPLADPPPERVRLGERLWANVLNLRLRPGVEVTRVELEALSEEIVIGLMGLTVMK